jgi:hypothetical protein
MNCNILKLLSIICLFTVQISLNAQKKLSNKIGVTVSPFGISDIFGKSNDDNYNYKSKNCFALGATYIRGLNKWLDIETGIEYSRYNIDFSPNIFPGTNFFMRTSKIKLGMINIPATLRANFLKYFFVNGGVLIDIDISNNIYFEHQTGIGGIGGFGANYNFNSGLSIFINPYIKAHSWIDIKTRKKILEKGIRLGITYDLHRIINK